MVRYLFIAFLAGWLPLLASVISDVTGFNPLIMAILFNAAGAFALAKYGKSGE